MSRRPASALPSTRARALAFAAIVLAGAFGSLIGFAVVDVQCHGGCGAAAAAGAIVGAVLATAGVAVIAVLTLRAMGEWSRNPPPAGSQPPSDSSRNPSA